MNLLEAIKVAKRNDIHHIYFNNPLDDSLFLHGNELNRLVSNGSVDLNMLLRDDYTVLQSKQIDKLGFIEIITDKENPYFVTNFKQFSYYDKKLPLSRFLDVYGERLDDIELGLLFDKDNHMLCDYVTVEQFLTYIVTNDKQDKILHSLVREIGTIYVSYNI